MGRIKLTQIRLLVKRGEIIKQLEEEGYNNADIGRIFNVDKSVISRIIKTIKDDKLSCRF